MNCWLNKFVFVGLACQPSAYPPILEGQGVSLRLDPPVGRDYRQLRYRRPVVNVARSRKSDRRDQAVTPYLVIRVQHPGPFCLLFLNE